jgi:hypothetical protein
VTASEHSGEHVRLPPRGARSWYDVLDVARDASDREIEAAYDRAIALIEGDSVGGYMVLDPDARASAKSDVETAFLVLSDPTMRAAFDASIGADDKQAALNRELAAAQLLDEDEWIASGPPVPATAAQREPSGPAPVADAANDDEEATAAAADRSEAETAPPSGAPPTPSSVGGGLRFLAPVYDDTSGPVAASPAAPDEDEGPALDEDRPSREPALSIAPACEDDGAVASTAEAPAEPPAPPPELRRAPTPRLTRDAPLDPDAVLTAPPTQQPLVSHIQTLPPELEHVLVEGAEVNGQVIRRLRESRNLSVDEVASATHIRKAYLVAIEDMDVDELPARVYLRGFLTQIARVLKVDKKALSDGYLSFIERFQK